MGSRFALLRAGKEALGRHGHFGRLYPVGTRILELLIRSIVAVLLQNQSFTMLMLINRLPFYAKAGLEGYFSITRQANRPSRTQPYWAKMKA
jgi:hypothetical protein